MGQVVCGGEDKCIKIFGGNLKERYHLEGLGVDGQTLLKWALKKQDGVAWTVLIWLWVGTSVGFV